jgi:hypothetical protein
MKISPENVDRCRYDYNGLITGGKEKGDGKRIPPPNDSE